MSRARAEPAALHAPLVPRVRIIRRGDDGQLRITFLPALGDAGAFDCRLFRRSPNVADVDDEYAPTSAGFCIPRAQAREFLGALAEALREVER